MFLNNNNNQVHSPKLIGKIQCNKTLCQQKISKTESTAMDFLFYKTAISYNNSTTNVHSVSVMKFVTCYLIISTDKYTME